jgi:hypothetical protein
MCTQEPDAPGQGVGVMAAPAVGWTTITTAGEEGRLPLAAAFVGLGVEPAGDVQAPTRNAMAAIAESREIAGRAMVGLMRS